MEKKFNLSKEDLAKLSQYEASIAHWSSEYTNLVLKSKKALDGVDSLYMARQKIIDDVLKDNDIKPSDIENISVSPNGEVSVLIRDN